MDMDVVQQTFTLQDSGSGERGCGRRVKGGLYAVTDIGDYGGDPWWTCLLDPPQPVTAQMMSEWGIAPRDVSLRIFTDPEGVQHRYLMDWLGAGGSPSGEGYWNPLDPIMEALSGKGFSGRLPEDKWNWAELDLKSGSPTQTTRWIIHPHAIDLHAEALWHDRLWDRYRGGCITYQDIHEVRDDPPEFCDSLWWESVEGGLPFNPADESDRRIIRQIGSVSYPAWRAPDGHAPEYQAGIILKLPFRLEIVVDPDGGHHETVAEKLEAAGQAYKFAED